MLTYAIYDDYFLLPRQFHYHYRKPKENHFENCHLVFWISIDFQFFVFPIAWGGKILFLGQNVNPELFPILFLKNLEVF